MSSSTSFLAERLLEMIDVPSTTGLEAAYGDLAQGWLEQQGYVVERQEVLPGRDNLVARIGGAQPEALLCTHLDTVPPHLPARLEGTTIFGRGACDTKGPLASMLEATSRLEPELRARTGYLLVVGEEVDHCGALAAVGLDLTPRLILLGEPTGSRFARTQKGILRLSIEASGRSGHSGYPELGPSAVHRLVETISALLAFEWPEDPVRGATTINIGRIEGGLAGNVIAPSARAEVVFRLVCEPDAILEAVDRCLVEGCVREVITAKGPLDLTVPDGFDSTVVSFHTDAPYLLDLGPVALVGPGDIRCAHSERERIEITDLESGADLYERAVRFLLEMP